jgi:hypothetical protein
MLKRSTINRSIEIAKQVFASVGFTLPPFAHWTADEWPSKSANAQEVRLAMLGWDVTDFGQGNFPSIGRILLTLRNGSPKFPSGKNYAEKLILDPENQKPPRHFHRYKMEDIINRGGGNVLVQLYQSTPQGTVSDEAVSVQLDGVTRTIPAGAILRLEPGQSITIHPGLIHQFWGESGTGVPLAGGRYVVSGEVSRICDDWNDNCWLEPCERFCKIEEDEPRKHYLVHEYPPLKSSGNAT